MEASVAAELKTFQNSNQEKLVLTILDPKIRAEIHEWSRQYGVLARTKYVPEELSQVRCLACRKWVDIKEKKIETPYSDGDFLSSPGDARVMCLHCQEDISWCNERDSMMERSRFRFKWKSTGEMLILRSTGIPYKPKGEAPMRANYRRHYKNRV